MTILFRHYDFIYDEKKYKIWQYFIKYDFINQLIFRKTMLIFDSYIL